MFRIVFQRKLGKGSLIVLTFLLVVAAGTLTSAVRPLNVLAASLDTCGYNPLAAPKPGGGTVVFNENTVTRAIAFYGVGLGGRVGVFTNDESGLYIGNGGTPSSAVAGQTYGEAVPPAFGGGIDGGGRPEAPTIYLTDITSDANATGGDWENNGQAATSGASALYGSWSPTLGTKPVNKNDWTLGPNADPIPATDAFGGTTTAFNEGYGSEVAWNVSGLVAYDPVTSSFVAVQPGHTYRAQSITHDTDQNKGYGDVGEVCTTFGIPAPPVVDILKTADAAQVNAGQSIGFTVTVSNSGTSDATGVTLSDPLPVKSGLAWTIDAQGTGWAGTCAIDVGGTLNCGPETVPANTTPAASTFTVHITSPTTAATGGSCPGTGEVDNTGTVDSTNAGSAQSSAETCVLVGKHLPPSCTALVIRPKQLYAGRATTVHMKITYGYKAVAGVRVRIKGAGLNLLTGWSNKYGKITQKIKPVRPGVVTFRTVYTAASCSKRLGAAKGAEKTLTG